jgi:hypothetical protein
MASLKARMTGLALLLLAPESFSDGAGDFALRKSLEIVGAAILSAAVKAADTAADDLTGGRLE